MNPHSEHPGNPASAAAEGAADYLVDAHRRRETFGHLPLECSPRDLRAAIRAQDAYARRLVAVRGQVAGYKVALTTPAMQKLTGFREPARGRLFEKTVHGSPHAIRGADFGRLGLECEVAIRIGRALAATDAPYDAQSVQPAVAAFMPAFEIIDDRGADYSKFAQTVFDFIADNTWNAGVVLGAPAPAARAGELPDARGRMHINGRLIAEGHGRDVLGHPLNALAWLANSLAGAGLALEPGMIVMTGSLVPTQFVQAGDAVRYELEGFGEITCSVT
jgi:2-keto-4-pentenoate hydratase